MYYVIEAGYHNAVILVGDVLNPDEVTAVDSRIIDGIER